jgi:hypothetical protein
MQEHKKRNILTHQGLIVSKYSFMWTFDFILFWFLLQIQKLWEFFNTTTAIMWGPSAASMFFFFPWRWGGSSIQAWMPTYVSTLRIPQMIWVWRATVEWYWQGKTEELWEKPVPVSLCPPQIPHGLTRVWTRASAVRGQWLTTWAMAQPIVWY